MEIIEADIVFRTHWNSYRGGLPFSHSELQQSHLLEDYVRNPIHKPKRPDSPEDNLLRVNYFGAGTVKMKLYRISVLTKLTRIAKLNLLVYIPLVLSDVLIYAIILAVVELFSIGVFCFKFTYKSVLCEYILMIGYICGILSSIELLIGDLFDLQYNFIGEVFMIILFIIPKPLLSRLIEYKYEQAIKAKPENKSEDSYLVDFLFAR